MNSVPLFETIYPRLSPLFDQHCQFPWPPAENRDVDGGGLALPSDIVDHVQDAEAAAVSKLGLDEIDRPPSVGQSLGHQWRPHSDGMFAGYGVGAPKAPRLGRVARSACASVYGHPGPRSHASAITDASRSSSHSSAKRLSGYFMETNGTAVSGVA